MDEDLSIRKPVRLRQLHKPGNEYAEFNIHSAPLTSVPRCMTAPFPKKEHSRHQRQIKYLSYLPNLPTKMHASTGWL